ncbi:spartin a [Polypterus senegalus]|nr:spartin a [Polypterus senegalus]
MEEGSEPFPEVNLQAIQNEYKKAFALISKGLTEDEAGRKMEAIEIYREGRQHLLRGIGIATQRPECIGPAWESAVQMQQKMKETLNNISTRLNILEQETSVAGPIPTNGVSDSPSGGGLYPTLPSNEQKPSRPPPPKVLPNTENRPIGTTNSPFCSLSPSHQAMPTELPPAYSPQAADGHFTLSYGTDSGELSVVGDEFYNQSRSVPPAESLGADGEELLVIPHGVQIFYVTPEGQVSAPSYPGYLRIIKFTNTDLNRMPHQPPAFLQVCDWLFPLMSADSPVLLCRTGVYMFPDMMSQVSGSYVGVVLSSELPEVERELFQDLMSQLTDLRIQAPEDPEDTVNLSQSVHIDRTEGEVEESKNLPEWSEKVAHGILTGASWLSWGLVKGAEYTGKAIHMGASKLRQHINPEEKPIQVNPTVAKGLHVAKQASGGAVKVSHFLVDGVCKIASTVGRELAPHVKKHGSKLIPESLKKDKEAKSNLDGAMVVAASGVQGFAAIWTGLEVAAKSISKSVASETVRTVKYKYGAAAGVATDNAVNSAINVGVTAFNIDNLGIKAVVKKTGKETAKVILEDYKVQEKKEEK